MTGTRGAWPVRWLGAACVLLALAGCEAGELPEFGSLIYENDDFEVWASDGLEACGGTHAYTEGWLAAFRRRVGEHGTPTHHRFYWLSPEDRDASPCNNKGGACTFWDRPDKLIYSFGIPVEHEIVHAELATSHSHPLLTEGAAEAFGSIAPSGSTSIFAISDLLDGSVLPVPGYPSAGRFTRYLLDTYGFDAYFDLMHAARDARSRGTIDAAFQRTLDLPIDEAIADYDTYSACGPPMWRYHDYECSDLPLVPWSSSAQWEQTITLDCEAPDVIGPRSDTIWTLRALEVETIGPYALTVRSDAPARAELESCDRSCFDGTGAYVPTPSATTDRDSGVVVLSPGRYWLRVELDADRRADVTVNLSAR